MKTLLFLLLLILSFDHMNDVNSDNGSECEFNSIHDAYEALPEESLKIKAKSIKVNYWALKVNESLKTKNVNLLNELVTLESEKRKLFNKAKFLEAKYNTVINKNKVLTLEIEKKKKTWLVKMNKTHQVLNY